MDIEKRKRYQVRNRETYLLASTDAMLELGEYEKKMRTITQTEEISKDKKIEINVEETKIIRFRKSERIRGMKWKWRNKKLNRKNIGI